MLYKTILATFFLFAGVSLLSTLSAQGYSVSNGRLVFSTLNDYSSFWQTLSGYDSQDLLNFASHNGYNSIYSRWYNCNDLSSDASISTYVATYRNAVYIDDSLSVEFESTDPISATIANDSGLYQIDDTLYFESRTAFNKMFPIDNRYVSDLMSAEVSDANKGIVAARQDVDYYEYCEVYHNGCTCYAPFQRIKCEVIYKKNNNYPIWYIFASTKYQWRNSGISFWRCNSNNGEVGFQFDRSFQAFDCNGRTTTNFTNNPGTYSLFSNVKPHAFQLMESEFCDFMQGSNGAPIYNVIHIARRSEWCHSSMVNFQCTNAIGD